MLLLLSNSASAKMQNSDGTGFGNHADLDAGKKLKQLKILLQRKMNNNVVITSLKDGFIYKCSKYITCKMTSLFIII